LSSKAQEKVHIFKIIVSFPAGNCILQPWHPQTFANAPTGCSALIIGRHGRDMHENEILVAGVLGEQLFQQQSLASGSHC